MGAKTSRMHGGISDILTSTPACHKDDFFCNVFQATELSAPGIHADIRMSRIQASSSSSRVCWGKPSGRTKQV